MKAQSSLEFMLLIALVGVVVIILIAYIYTTYLNIQKTFPTINEYISSFNIDSFNETAGNLCSFNFSFSSQAKLSPMPIYLKINSKTGKFYFISVNSTDYTEINYYQTSGTYYYKYTYTSSAFNSTICNLFNTYNNGNIGDISEIVAGYNGKMYAFKLYSPQQTIYP